MTSKKRILTLALLAALLTLLATPALAQGEDPGLTLKLSRDFGYGGFAGEIQGNFSVRVEGPANLVLVRYYIDDVLLAESTDAPEFRVRFVTDDHAPGRHDLTAVGVLDDGTEMRSQVIARLFLGEDEAHQTVTNIIGPVFAIVGLALALGALLPLLTAGRRKKTFRLGQYGMLGGTVCRKCGRPFSLSLMGLKLGFGRLERCPHCGKWSLTRRASAEDLAAAERRMESSDAVGAAEVGESEEDRLRRMVDESRFED